MLESLGCPTWDTFVEQHETGTVCPDRICHIVTLGSMNSREDLIYMVSRQCRCRCRHVGVMSWSRGVCVCTCVSFWVAALFDATFEL